MEPKPQVPLQAISLDEARAQAVERLCDGFAHDARNPLNAVVIHLEVLSDKLRRENGGAVPTGLEKNLKAIRDQVNRIDEMVRRFVEIAAPHRQHEAELDLAALVHSVVEQCTHQARLARADLRADATSPVRINGSASELGVALTLAILEQLDGGAKRLLVRLEPAAGSVRVAIEGAIAAVGPAMEGLRRVAQTHGGTATAAAGRLELGLPRQELRVLSEESSESARHAR